MSDFLLGNHRAKSVYILPFASPLFVAEFNCIAIVFDSSNALPIQRRNEQDLSRPLSPRVKHYGGKSTALKGDTQTREYFFQNLRCYSRPPSCRWAAVLQMAIKRNPYALFFVAKVWTE